MTSTADTPYLLRRAHEEAVRAIQATHRKAAAAHQRLAILYSARAALALVNGDADRAALLAART